MADSQMPGLERLMEVCRRLGFYLHTEPPARAPLMRGDHIGPLPVDPLLATFYAHFGGGAFATDVAGISVFRMDDRHHELEERNSWWRESWQRRLPLPLLVFGGEPGVACYYNTVPGLADAQGRQPVIQVDTDEEPYGMPVASDVDQFFGTYSRYLEMLVATPGYEEERAAVLAFPQQVPGLVAQDARLVALLRSGRFAPLMESEPTRCWVREVLEAAG